MVDPVRRFSNIFNDKGTRLVCEEKDYPPVVCNVPTEQRPNEMGKVYLAAKGFSSSRSRNSCCFAGENDELVVACSRDNNLFIWSVPEDGGGRKIDHSTLQGHKNSIFSIRYCKVKSVLASCGREGIIKLWNL